MVDLIFSFSLFLLNSFNKKSIDLIFKTGNDNNVDKQIFLFFRLYGLKCIYDNNIKSKWNKICLFLTSVVKNVPIYLCVCDSVCGIITSKLINRF